MLMDSQYTLCLIYYRRIFFVKIKNGVKFEYQYIRILLVCHFGKYN